MSREEVRKQKKNNIIINTINRRSYCVGLFGAFYVHGKTSSTLVVLHLLRQTNRLRYELQDLLFFFFLILEINK